MNQTLKLTSTTIIGLIVIGITIVVFFLGTPAPRTLVDWQSLSFVLISEFLAFGSLIYLTMSLSASNKRIIHIGILSTLMIYWAASVTLAIFRHLFDGNQNLYVMINIVFIGIVIIVTVLLNMSASKVQSMDNKTVNTAVFLQDIEKRLFSLQSNNGHSEFKQTLTALYENIKFSDKFGSSSHDKAISDQISHLETVLCDNADDKKEKVEKTISQILFFVKQRNMELLQDKRDGF